MPPSKVKDSNDIYNMGSSCEVKNEEIHLAEMSYLLGITIESVKFSFVLLQSRELEEDIFTSRLRKRFQGLKYNQLPLESNEEILRYLGLDSFCEAWNYVISKCSLADNHLDIVEWAVLYLQDIIRYQLCLENVYGKFPYKETIVNTWFKHVQGEEESSKTINVLNMIENKQKKDEPYPLLNGNSFPEGLEEEGFEMFYHGTDHKSAISILEDGIDLQKGKSNRDFSHGKGFYVNDKYQEARNWAFRIRNAKQAVVIFKIPKAVLDNFRSESIDLCQEKELSDWFRIIENFRSNPSKSFLKEFKRISFIEGPIASVVVRGSVKIKGPIEESYQMCLHSDELAEEFDLYLHSVVFF